MSNTPKITLDANCVINLLDSSTKTATSVDFLSKLLRHSHSGNVDIAITTRVEADLRSDSDEIRKKGVLRRIVQFPVVGTIARFGVTKYGSGDVYGGDKSKEIADELKRLIFPALTSDDKRFKNKINDIDHLVGHLLNGRDIFVTDDREIIKKGATLKSSLGLVAMTPKECLDYVDSVVSEKKEEEFSPSKPKDGHHSPALYGIASFDYSNNNGLYSIGNGYFLFETKWSAGGRDAIHAYNDPASIDSIALTKTINEIQKIKDATSFDFSSRSRTPHEGQILILKNKNGIYAVIKVLDVKYEDNGDDRDELTFTYFIQSNRTSSFEDAPIIPEASYYDFKAITDQYYTDWQMPSLQVFVNLLTKYGIELRGKDGTLHEGTFSVPKTESDALVLGMRYKKNDGSFSEDLFLFRKDQPVEKGYKGAIEGILPEYKGTHKRIPTT